MISIEKGKINLHKLEISDLIDISVLQQFLDNFAIGMNCAAVSVNRNGGEVTKPSYYRDFCANHVHKSPIGDARCAQCHNKMGEEAMKQQKPYVGYCHAGLIDFAAPVIVSGELIGTVLGGQILDKAPNENEIRSLSGELNVNPDGLWEAAKGIDIVPRMNIDAAAQVLFVVVNNLAEAGYRRIEIELLSSELAENFLQISQTVETLAESAQDITTSQQDLSSEISEVSVATHEISEVLQAITRVADKTKLIGLNASIEAARLGTAGRSFAIVANEIRNLSENTKNTAAQITKLNSQINDRIDSTISNSDKTLGITQDQSAAMEELSATVQNLVDVAERLKSLFEEK